MSDQPPIDPVREQALDAALTRALTPPALPAGFRSRLTAAIARESAAEASELQAARQQLEREQRLRLQQLDGDFVRLRRRTLGTLIGGAFAAGAAVAVAMPLLQARFGHNAAIVMAVSGAVVGLALGTASWIARLELPALLRRL